ncbi:hypothetical protein B0H10DRAFT_2445214, partial [Mycena sp. CBHHK59/15]
MLEYMRRQCQDHVPSRPRRSERLRTVQCIAMNVRRPSFRRSGRGPYPVRQLSGSHVPPRPHPRAASICTHVETDSRSSATGHDTPHTAQGRRDTSAALPRL